MTGMSIKLIRWRLLPPDAGADLRGVMLRQFPQLPNDIGGKTDSGKNPNDRTLYRRLTGSGLLPLGSVRG